MKKNFALGILAFGLIAAGGTGAYVAYAKDNSTDSKVMMHHQGMGTSQMSEMMKNMNTDQMSEMMKNMDPDQMSKMMKNMDPEQMKEMQKLMESKDFSFEKMLPYMKKMHPELSDKELKSLFENMHGKNGTPHCGGKQESAEVKKSSSI